MNYRAFQIRYSLTWTEVALLIGGGLIWHTQSSLATVASPLMDHLKGRTDVGHWGWAAVTSLISETRITLSVWVLTHSAGCWEWQRWAMWLSSRCRAAACRTRVQQRCWSLHWAAACPSVRSGPAPLLHSHQAEMGAVSGRCEYMLSQLRVIAEEQLLIIKTCQMI